MSTTTLSRPITNKTTLAPGDQTARDVFVGNEHRGIGPARTHFVPPNWPFAISWSSAYSPPNNNIERPMPSAFTTSLSNSSLADRCTITSLTLDCSTIAATSLPKSGSICKRSMKLNRTLHWVTAVLVDWLPAFWIRWPRSPCPDSATASITNTACSAGNSQRSTG